LIYEVLSTQINVLINSFIHPKKNIKELKDKKIRSIYLSFLFYIIMFSFLLNGLVVLIEMNYRLYLPLLKLSGKYILFALLFSTTISFLRMKAIDIIFNNAKLKHTNKFNKKMFRNAIAYYLNIFLIINFYMSLNLYMETLMPAINILIWGLIIIFVLANIIQSIYISYTPYYKKKKTVRKHLLISTGVNFIFTTIVYIFLVNPIIQVFF